MLNLIAVLVLAFLGWLLGRAIGYVIGFRGGHLLLERPGRTQKFRLKTIDKGEKLAEVSRSFCREFTTLERREPLQRLFLKRSMVVLLNIHAKIPYFTSKIVEHSRHLPSKR